MPLFGKKDKPLTVQFKIAEQIANLKPQMYVKVTFLDEEKKIELIPSYAKKKSRFTLNMTNYLHLSL